MTRLPLRERNRQHARDVILDAAERLLGEHATADFSMRALAAEAGVGFATPFNHFGSKTAIMQALSTRLIDSMAERYVGRPPAAGSAIDRVLAMGQVATGRLLEQPEVSKAVVGSLGVASPDPGAVRRNSGALWSLALGELDGIAAPSRATAAGLLPGQLAYLFRGCVSFWIAGELRDDELGPAFTTGASALLLGFAEAPLRQLLLDSIDAGPDEARQQHVPGP